MKVPFISREKEIRQIRKFYKERKYVLVLGPEGVGKTALISHLRDSLDFVLCSDTTTLGAICECLENELGIVSEGLKLPFRRQKIFQTLVKLNKIVVFDSVGWATPRVSAFMEWVRMRLPVWVCSRSGYPWDIGHFWLYLCKFNRIDLHPFHLSETRALIESAVNNNHIPAASLDALNHLQRVSNGNPKILCELIEGLSSGRYDPHKLNDLKLLDIDRRVQNLHLPNLHEHNEIN